MKVVYITLHNHNPKIGLPGSVVTWEAWLSRRDHPPLMGWFSQRRDQPPFLKDMALPHIATVWLPGNVYSFHMFPWLKSLKSEKFGCRGESAHAGLRKVKHTTSGTDQRYSNRCKKKESTNSPKKVKSQRLGPTNPAFQPFSIIPELIINHPR